MAASVFRLVSQLARREFRFEFAKGCCIIAGKEKDQYKKIKYFILTVDSYNEYLRRRSQFQIKYLKEVYSKFIYAHIEEKNEITKSIYKSLENSSDRLELARCISALTRFQSTEIFIRESILQKLKVAGTVITTAIPIGISIYQVIMHQGP